MANKGYVTEAQVEGYLGRAFNSAQQAQITALIGAVEGYVDRETKRSWILPPIVGEIYQLPDAFDDGAVMLDEAGYPIPSSLSTGQQRPPTTIYLQSIPVASVQQVQTRTTRVGDTYQTLQAGIDYELVNAGTGQLVFADGYGGPNAIASVSYTPSLPIPPDLSLGATMLVALWLKYQINPDSIGVESYKFADGPQITFDDGQLYAQAIQMIHNWRKTVIG